VNRANLTIFLLRRFFPGAETVLEIGCGTGAILLALKAAFPLLRLTGSELLREGLEFARQRLGGTVLLLQMDARCIPAVQEFDVICALDVIEHIHEDSDVLAQIYAALRPGGGTIIAVPQHPWLWSPADESACHKRRYTRGEVEAKLQKAGFRVLHSTSFNAFLLPLMIASRYVMIARARSGGKIEALSELQTPGWLNGILSAILRFEITLTALGIRWPIGGSRFVVAQRAAK
jgi:SAM-dependent methyltransferase